MEFCPHGTRIECLRAQQATDELEAANKKAEAAEEESTTSVSTIEVTPLPTVQEIIAVPDDHIPVGVVIIKCKKLHFKKIIQLHTDESLGDCSFLNTCFHMDTCK